MSGNRHGGKTPEVESPAPPARDEKGRLLPGNTANPGGNAGEVVRFRELLKGLHPQTARVARKVLDRAENTAALDAIIADGETSPEVRLEAENALNARLKLGTQMAAEVWKYSVPKPTQRHKVSGHLQRGPLDDIPTEELQAFLKKGKEEKGGG